MKNIRIITLLGLLTSMLLLSGCLKYSKKRTYFTDTSDNRDRHGVIVYRHLRFTK